MQKKFKSPACQSLALAGRQKSKVKINQNINNESLTTNLQAGQVLLIIVLVMVVSLTVGLAVVSRSIVSVRTSTEEENSQRAFSAAEAGIERALKSGETIIGSNLETDPNKPQSLIKTASVASIEGTSFLLNGGNPVDKNDGTDIWLVPHNSDGTPNYASPWSGRLNIYWGLAGGACNNIAALEVIVISGSLSAPSSNRYVYDPCSTRRGENHFSSPTTGSYNIDGKTFNYSASIPPTGDPEITNGFIARVIPFYISTTVGVVGTVAIPSQGKKVEAVGESGGTARKVNLFQGWRKLPSEFFQYVIFSP